MNGNDLGLELFLQNLFLIILLWQEFEENGAPSHIIYQGRFFFFGYFLGLIYAVNSKKFGVPGGGHPLQRPPDYIFGFMDQDLREKLAKIMWV